MCNSVILDSTHKHSIDDNDNQNFDDTNLNNQIQTIHNDETYIDDDTNMDDNRSIHNNNEENNISDDNKKLDDYEKSIQSSSPDETALVVGMNKCKVKIISKTQSCITFERVDFYFENYKNILRTINKRVGKFSIL